MTDTEEEDSSRSEKNISEPKSTKVTNDQKSHFRNDDGGGHPAQVFVPDSDKSDDCSDRSACQRTGKIDVMRN